jgi:predicted O-methyltransferase YrrM
VTLDEGGPTLEWHDDTRLVVDGTRFAVKPMGFSPEEAAYGLALLKPRWMVERYAELRSQIDPANIFELGIYEGGSAAMLALLFRPRRLVAIDLNPKRVPALDDFIDAHGMAETLRPYYGVDQTDRPRLEAILDQEYASEPLDLVIDDASHLLHETTASFNLLFPRLRPGGLFVIEDWSWRHDRERALAEKLRTDPQAREALGRRLEAGDQAAPKEDPLSRLVLELVLTAAYAEDIISEITGLQRGWLIARRGDATLDPNTFDISQCYGSLGQTLLHELRPRA